MPANDRPLQIEPAAQMPCSNSPLHTEHAAQMAPSAYTSSLSALGLVCLPVTSVLAQVALHGCRTFGKHEGICKAGRHMHAHPACWDVIPVDIFGIEEALPGCL